MNIRLVHLFSFLLCMFYIGCDSKKTSDTDPSANDSIKNTDSLIQLNDVAKILTGKDIELIKDLQFENYTLDDEYPYKDTTRQFQWEKIKEHIASIENATNEGGKWAVLSNYKNMNRESPTIEGFSRDEYGLVSDKFGVARYQSSPLYSAEGDTILARYGRDGWLVKLLDSDTVKMVRVKGVSFEGEFLIPNRYLKSWGDTIQFTKVAVVDVTNQNIATLEKSDKGWRILSMNPATTGRHKPPYAQETPTGIFAVQEKKVKMFYTKDGSRELDGFAPYASRFTNGAHIHGVPVKYPRETIIEYSASLGTIPRSHMCVRNASSHAKFVFDWAIVKQSIVVVID